MLMRCRLALYMVLLELLVIETYHLIRACLFDITDLVMALILMRLNLLGDNFSHKHALFDVKGAIVLLVDRSLLHLLLASG